jgi:catechol 2,3-dioxygenase-like lactoylglutathione lyase family enzyme
LTITFQPKYIAIVSVLIARVACAQAPGFASLPGKAQPAAVTGLYHWIHSTADLDRGWEFYHSVFAVEFERSPFGGNAPAAQRPRPRAEASADPMVWDLTNTRGSHFRNLFMTLPGVPFGYELSEFSGIEQRPIRANLWDPGATILILNVSHLDSSLDALKKAGGEIVSRGGKPVSLDGTKAVIARDPDGYLLELIESDKAHAAIGITVAHLEQTRRFYEDLLGFKIQSPALFESKALNLVGLTGGEYRVSSALIPGTSSRIEFFEFREAAGLAGEQITPHPLRYRIQDPGAPQFQFRVRDLDGLLEGCRRRGVSFLSVDGKPIERAFGRFVFVTDPDGIPMEFVHPKR